MRGPLGGMLRASGFGFLTDCESFNSARTGVDYRQVEISRAVLFVLLRESAYVAA